MATDLLDLEVRLLILKHGRSRVIQSLANVEGATVEDLAARLDQLSRVRAPAKVKRRYSLEESIKDLDITGNKRAQIMLLTREFEHKRLLPQLRDVIRFCAQHGENVRPKSRNAALPRLVRIFATLPNSELADLTERLEKGGEGSFERLADAIIRGA